MTKVAFNACYGGFTLSEKAIQLGRQLSGNDKWGSPRDELVRHDPTLIAVITQLGSESGGPFSALDIAEIPDWSKYRIDEYDGVESVETPESYDWVIPSAASPPEPDVLKLAEAVVRKELLPGSAHRPGYEDAIYDVLKALAAIRAAREGAKPEEPDKRMTREQRDALMSDEATGALAMLRKG